MTDKTGLTNLNIGDLMTPKSTGIVFNYECEAAVTKGDPVYLSSDEKVSPATSAQDCIGIATKDGAVGEVIGIAGPGNRVKVKAGAAITRGKAVQGGDASRRITMLTDQAVAEGGSANYTIYYARKLGIAEQAASAADDLISIFLCK